MLKLLLGLGGLVSLALVTIGTVGYLMDKPNPGVWVFAGVLVGAATTFATWLIKSEGDLD